MKVLSIKIEVDKIPKSCRYNSETDDGCIFCENKYCTLKFALEKESWVGNNYDSIPDDCPLK